MTAPVVRDVIQRAARLMGTVASGDAVTADELGDAMLSLNTMKRALFGTVIGPRLTPQDCFGLTGKQAENGGEYQIPSAPFTLTAPTNPRSGSRFGVVDANLTFASYACFVARNGRLIEGANASLTLSVNGDNRRWWFRGDAGDWVREADYVTADDVIEFPEGLIAYMPYMLAVTQAAEYGATIEPAVATLAEEGRMAFARAYGRRGRSQLDPPFGMNEQQAPARQG